MSTTSGNPNYSSRSMNGINQISVIDQTITGVEETLTNISYNNLTDTTTITDNTALYNVVINGTLTTTGGQLYLTSTSNATITGTWGFNNSIKLNSNNLTLSSNGVMSFVDDGLSGAVVDTIHNQNITGTKTFNGIVNTSTLTCNSLTYPDGSTQTTSNYLTPIQVNATDRITSTNSMQTNQLTANDIYCGTINISDKLIDANNTGTSPKSFIYSSTIMCYKDVIVNNTPLVVAVGQYVKSNGIGLAPFGDSGITITSIDTTNRLMTFSSGGFTFPPSALTSSLCAITTTNTIISYDNISSTLNKGIRGSGTSTNQPFVNALTGSYQLTTPTTSLTTSIVTTKTGYINSNSRLVTLDTFTNQNFINMTGVSNPTYLPSSYGTNEYNILSRNTITPSSTTTFIGIPLSTTSLSYFSFSGAINSSFITQLNNISAGTKASANNTTTGTITLTLSHTLPTITTITKYGYVFNNQLVLESSPLLALNLRVVGTGTGINGIPADINSFITAQPTAPSSQYTIKSGTGTLSPTNTATTQFIGYVRVTSGIPFFISNNLPAIDNFVITTGSNIPQATRISALQAPYLGQNNILCLSQINGYSFSSTTPSYTLKGYVASSTSIRVTSAPVGLPNSGLFLENASSFNSLIPNGTTFSWNSTNQTFTCTGLTGQTSTGQLQGYMRTSSILELRGWGTTTPAQNYFITGTGTPSTKNYVSNVTSQTPFTLGSTGIAATGTTIAGYTKADTSSTISLVIANITPFTTASYFVTGGLLSENTGLGTANSGIVKITADNTTYGSGNYTTREPTTGSYLAYAFSSTQYCILSFVTSLFGATNYIETSFAPYLTQLGSVASNIYTSSNLTASASTSNIIGATITTSSGYYFCSSDTGNYSNTFLVHPTLAQQSSVVYNSTTFDKGSNNLSLIQYKSAPPSTSSFLTNAMATIGYYVRTSSVSVGGGKYDTEIFFRTPTRLTISPNVNFFINGSSSTIILSSGLNGSYVFTSTPNTTGGGGKLILRGNNAVTANTFLVSSNNISGSGTTYTAIFTGTAPVNGDFVTINSRTNCNYITAISNVGTTYTITLSLTEGTLVSGVDTIYIYRCINTTSSIIVADNNFSSYVSSNLVIYQTGGSFTYYPQITYDYFAPININVIADTCNTFSPISYTIQSPLTYSYLAPISITDYGRTTIDFMNTETITYYNYYAVNLPNASATYTLVGDNTIQTMTNKTLTSPTINTPTINTPTITSPSINTALTLFGNAFNYVPWTSIQTWDGGTYSTSPLAVVINSLSVAPSTNAATRIRYIYSVIGKNLYMNYFFYQPNNTGTNSGTGIYYYKFPTGYTSSSAVSSSLVSYDSTNIITYGSRVGTCILHINATSLNYGSVYYVNVIGINYLVLLREQSSVALQSSTNFQYGFSGIATYSFEACIPLA